MEQIMKAYYCTSYGAPEVLELRDIPTPTPKAHQMLIKIHAVPATVGDSRIRAFRIPPSYRFMAKLALGFKRPRNPILGRYFAGEVFAIGNKVSQFSVGDRVFGCTGRKFSTYAEFIRIAEKDTIAKIPNNISFEEAAASLWGNVTAIHFLKNAEQNRDKHILINGASGSVGLSAVQLAKFYGLKVTGVCSSKNVALVKSAGADHVIDYTQEDFTESNEPFDAIFDAVGNKPIDQLIKPLRSTGKLMHAVATPDVTKEIKKALKGTDQTFVGGTVKWNSEMMSFITERLAKGDFKPMIDSTFPFSDMVSAHHRVDSGRKTGDVIVTVGK